MVECLQDQGCDFYWNLIKGNSLTTSSLESPSSVELPTEMDFSQDKTDKYDLLSIGNVSTSASTAVALFGFAVQDRLPPSRKDDSYLTTIQVRVLLKSKPMFSRMHLAEVACCLFAGSGV